MSNSIKTVMLIALMMGLLLFLGQAIGGEQGLVFAFIISLLMNFGMYWFSDKIVLMSYRAQEVTEEESPRLYRICTAVGNASAITDAESVHLARRNSECVRYWKKS